MTARQMGVPPRLAPTDFLAEAERAEKHEAGAHR